MELGGNDLKRLFFAGAHALCQNREEINELNVFPVPDGDTGTNMTMTVMSAVKEVQALDNPTINGMYFYPKWEYYCKIFSKDMDLTVEGRYSMNDLEGNYDIYVEKGSVTLAGDFTLKTYGTAVFSEHDMVFKSGTFALYGKSPSAPSPLLSSFLIYEALA